MKIVAQRAVSKIKVLGILDPTLAPAYTQCDYAIDIA